MKTNKNADNQSVEEKYYAMVEQVFDQVEARRRGGEKVIHEDLTSGMKMWCLTGGCSAVGVVGAAAVAVVGLAQGQVDLEWVGRIGFSAAILTVPLMTYLIGEDSSCVRGLELAGKTIGLQPYQRKKLADWTAEYPRVFELLTKWGSQHPDMEITGADYYHIEKAAEKIDFNRDYYPAIGKKYANVEEFEAELDSAIRRKVLSGKAKKRMGGGQAEEDREEPMEKSRPKM